LFEHERQEETQQTDTIILRRSARIRNLHGNHLGEPQTTHAPVRDAETVTKDATSSATSAPLRRSRRIINRSENKRLEPTITRNIARGKRSAQTTVHPHSSFASSATSSTPQTTEPVIVSTDNESGVITRAAKQKIALKEIEHGTKRLTRAESKRLGITPKEHIKIRVPRQREHDVLPSEEGAPEDSLDAPEDPIEEAGSSEDPLDGVPEENAIEDSLDAPEEDWTKRQNICFLGVDYGNVHGSEECTNLIIRYLEDEEVMPENKSQEDRMLRAKNTYNYADIIDIRKRGDNVILSTFSNNVVMSPFSDKYVKQKYIVMMGTRIETYTQKINNQETFPVLIGDDNDDLEFVSESALWTAYTYTKPPGYNPNIWAPQTQPVYAHPDGIVLNMEVAKTNKITIEPIGCSCLDSFYRGPITPDEDHTGELFTGCKHMWYLRYCILTGEFFNEDF